MVERVVICRRKFHLAWDWRGSAATGSMISYHHRRKRRRTEVVLFVAVEHYELVNDAKLAGVQVGQVSSLLKGRVTSADVKRGSEDMCDESTKL